MLKLVVLAAVASAIAAVPLEREIFITYPHRFMDFSDSEDLLVEPNNELIEEITRNPANTLYMLYTRRNPHSTQNLVIGDVNSIKSSFFNPHHKTVVLVHGWLSNQNSDINVLLRDGKSDTNVIVVDWRRLANSGYVTAVIGVPAVGRGLGQFLVFLNQVTGVSYESIHLIGFSLGAHLVGNAGRSLGGGLGRITGLDPAGPLWNYNSDRLSSSDARYVECIHTDGDLIAGYGIGSAIGHVDFFPNGGSNQPGCITNICDHNRAVELFAATVSHNHLIGIKCENNLQITLNSCRGTNFLAMGNDDVRKTGTGMYRLNTGRRYPF